MPPTSREDKEEGGGAGRSAAGLVSFYRRGVRVGNGASKTDHQPEISEINLMLPIPYFILSHLALTPPDQEGQHWPTVHTGVSCDSQC